MGKSAPAVPAVPTAAETAAASGQANTSTAAAQTALNDVNQVTPYGDTSYAATGSYTDPQGDTVPTYTQTTSLSPMGQQILTGEQTAATSLIPAAENLAGQVQSSSTTPLNFNTADSSILNAAPQQLDQTAANAVYNEQAGFLNPQWQQTEQQLQDQLSRQGIPVGSIAYNNAQTQEENAQTQAYQAAQDSATAQGASQAQALFGMAQAGQNQNIQQQQLAEQQPISLLSQIYGATPATPTQPITTPTQAGVAPTDTTGATATADNAAMQAYQAQLAQQNATYGGVAGAVGTAATAAAIAY